MAMVGQIAGFVIWLYLLVLTVRAVVSVIPLFVREWRPRGAVLVVAEAVYTVTDPPIKFLRRFIKPVKLGGTSWDLAFLVLYIGLTLVQRVVYVVL